MRGSSIGVCRLLAPVVLVLGACAGSGPGETPPVNPMTYGRFDLITHEAKPLPDTLRILAGISTTPGSTAFSRCPEVLTGATLDIATDGTLTRTSHLAYPCTGTLPSGLPDTLTQVETGTAVITGSNVTLTFGPTTAGISSSSKESGRVQDRDLVIDEVRTGMNFGSVEQRANARVYRHE